ncbi:MAG: PH domain-containing protein [Phycisphaerales bacterium JB041]
MITENTITFENVQNVSVRQGPLQRHFGIANVLVQTAGGGGSAGEGGSSAGHQGLLEGVDDAQTLRTLIMQRAEASKGAGLGDDREDAGARGTFGPAHVAALREIRDALATT